MRKKLVSLTVRFSSRAVSSRLPSRLVEQEVIRVEGIQLAHFDAALQAVLQKIHPALVKKHAAFLIDQRLQEL